MVKELDDYYQKLKDDDSKKLYEFWHDYPMSGPISFDGDYWKNWNVIIEMYETYEKLDNDGEYLRRIDITKDGEMYKVVVTEMCEDFLIEENHMTLEEVKECIVRNYEEVKCDIKD